MTVPDHDLVVGFPVVGMVASAGGLEAFKRFFSTMPADSGMAFILIPHLDPTRESLMVGLLSKLTPMPVVEAQQDMVVQINKVYIIPPNKFLAISHGQLQLSDHPHQRGWQTSIDFFLRSLAKDQTERAIGIVLSGTGSHGALGVREIKLAGGMTMAQQPETAEFDQMPENAIATGQIDSILPPEQMPAALVNYVEQPYLSSAAKIATPSTESNDLLKEILNFLQSRTKYDFSTYRKAMVLRRIQRRMGLAQIDSMMNYLTFLHQRPEEATALYKDLLISVTAFFRDSEAYRVLEQQLIPVLIARRTGDLPIRVWVPGCATGEEAYSLAMLLLEAISTQPVLSQAVPNATREGTGNVATAVLPSLQVFASDIDDDAIEVARIGIYPASVVSDVSEERLKRFFVAVDDNHYRINKQLRESIVFSHQNLISDAPFSKLDLISCRNLLIYLEPEMQHKVISLLHFALATDGYLFLGPSESIGRAINLFETVSKKWRIFRRIGPSRRDLVGFPLIKADQRPNSLRYNLPAELPPKSLKVWAETLVLNEYAPAAALINRKYEILYITGPLVNYLEFPAGELTKDLLAMARTGLRTKLCISCNIVIREGRTVVDTKARVKRNGKYVPCSITVRPLTEPKEAEGLMLVTFQDHNQEQTPNATTGVACDTDLVASFQDEDSAMVKQLEFELKSLSEELHNTIDEMESSTEELKTSNEEIMSVNEELQSANEELETSKEELQSLNEELVTVNTQLQEKVAELDIAKDDLINLMSSTEIATIFLDESLNIKRFTPPTASLLNLRSTDVGRPLRDITPRFVDDQMLVECQQVLETITPSEREIQTDEQRQFLRRILPYRSMDHHLGGVVITFVDITQRKQAEEAQRVKDRLALEALHESTERLATILDTAADAIITFDQQGRIDSINQATQSLFGFEREELLGQPISMLIRSIEDKTSELSVDSDWKAILKPLLGRPHEVIGFCKNGSLFPIELVVSKVDDLGLYTAFVRDISERKRLQAHILDISSEEQSRIGHELHDGTQQELTGMSLFAGTLCELLDNAVHRDTQDSQAWTMDNDTLMKLKQTSARLLEGLKKAYEHVHKLSHGIMPVHIDAEGLRSALAELASTTNDLQHVNCRIDFSGAVSVPSNQIATQLYRIAQESLNNAMHHGQADDIHIALMQQPNQIILEIRDNGIGMKEQPRREGRKGGRGMGLRIMDYRASLLGGFLQVESNVDSGVTIRCVVPFKEGEI